MATESARSRARRRSRTHRMGEAEGDVYVHAVRRRTRPSGPIAMCGCELREGPLHLSDEATQAESFEELATTYWGACPRCCELLGLEIDQSSVSAGEADESGWSLMKVLGVFGIVGMFGVVGLVRVLVFILRRS